MDQLEHVPDEVRTRFEEAIREAGVSLPPGVSTDDVMRGMMEQAKTLALDPKIQNKMQICREIIRQVKEELPGGEKHPDFLKILKQRLPRFESDGGASA